MAIGSVKEIVKYASETNPGKIEPNNCLRLLVDL